LLLVLCAAGCAAAPDASRAAVSEDPLGDVPADFSVDLTVLAGPDTGATKGAAAPVEPAGRDVHRRPGHYVVLCDGMLHWSEGGAEPGRGLPPAQRLLDQQQMAGLWLLLDKHGYADPARGAEPVNPRIIEAQPGETVWLAIITGRGQRWAFLRRAGPDGEPDPSMSELVGHLARLAWADTLAEPALGVPRRFDYGPDPYARYRR
jgi:hypothetical protein